MAFEMCMICDWWFESQLQVRFVTIFFVGVLEIVLFSYLLIRRSPRLYLLLNSLSCSRAQHIGRHNQDRSRRATATNHRRS